MKLATGNLAKVIGVAASVSLLAAACAAPTAPPGTTTPTVLPPVPTINKIRIPAGDQAWTETSCTMMPEDNIWHADVRGLASTSLDHFPTQVEGSRGGQIDPLSLKSGFPRLDRSGDVVTQGKIINFVDHSAPVAAVVSTGASWQRESEYTRVRRPRRTATGGIIDQHIPAGGVEMQLTSRDDHAYFVDVDRCTLYEHIGWNRRPSVHESDKVSVFDLETNFRRLSSHPGWTASPWNGGPGATIESAFVATDSSSPGMDGHDIEGPRGPVGATSGSGLAGSAGLVRVDEVFAKPLAKDQSVDAAASIDHALSVVVPAWHVSSEPTVADRRTPAPFVWPATRSDGCGGGSRCVGDAAGHGTGHRLHLAMGSRLKLGAAKCNATYEEPQAALIVKALCSHGATIIDSSARFALNVESSDKWSPAASAELEALHLRDFELVDTTPLARIDTNALWSTAINWAADTYGDGRRLAGGWYEGTFWNHLLREPVTAPGSIPTPLAKVHQIVNSEDWLQSTH